MVVCLVACGCGESSSDGSGDGSSTGGTSAGSAGTSGANTGGGSGEGGNGVGGSAVGGSAVGGSAVGGSAVGGNGGSGVGGSGVGGSGGASGSAGDSGAGGESGGSGGVDCSGEWGDPEVLRTQTEYPASLSLTADELLLYYVERATLSDPELYMLARRDDETDPFPAGEPIAELNEQCSELSRAIDISEDGLRVYFGCAYDAVGPETVYFGQRPDRSQPFSIDPMPLVSESGRQFDVTRSELVAFSSSNPIGASPLTYTRSAPLGPFGDGGPVLGLETTVFAWPTLANDDRTLFGTQSGVLVTTTRSAPDEPFGDVVQIPLDGEFYTSVAISADCRSLYYLNGLEDLTVWNLEVLRR